jgi:hypothetical protein
MNRSLLLTALAVALAGAAQAQPGYTADYDTVRAGRFDAGRMFTLDDLPRDYFEETYDFTPTDDWLEHARLGALRFATYCSASFVSADGLILTNHHCARESVTQAGLEDGQDYNEDGFYARTMDEEKPIEGLFVEQLIEIVDVTDEVNAAAEGAADNAGRQQARQAAIAAIQDRMLGERGGEEGGMRVQVVTLYSGGQYKAYVYRRYDTVRLVFAPETALGFFGGDPDNFTYPRYALDFSLFRAVDENGDPLEVEHFFRFDPTGTEPGDLVFVLGNPGSTTRMQTIAQLEFRRDFSEPQVLEALRSREEIYGAWLAANPDAPEAPELTDTWFSLGNSRKVYVGRLEGLRDPYIMARKQAAERGFLAALAEDPALQAEYGDVVEAIAANRQNVRGSGMGMANGAFIGFGPGSPLSSAVEQRAILAAQYAGASGDQQAELREALLEIEDMPADLQEALLAQRLRDFQTYLGSDADAVLRGRTPEAAAREIAQRSALATAEGTERLLDGDVAADPAVAAVMAVMPRLQAFQQAVGAANAELGELGTRLALARFGLYGTSVPPDATFTLRISDGVVRGYPYNGTVAPTHTTLLGLYDRYYSHCVTGEGAASAGATCDWTLPERWLEAVGDLDLATPFNLVSTNDIIGGNSGSPLLDRDLNVVGIVFDGNIESLPGHYIFIDTYNRTVSVDVRIMLESLEAVYGMDRVATELRNGGM